MGLSMTSILILMHRLTISSDDGERMLSPTGGYQTVGRWLLLPSCC